jgi:hypothetical protein
MSHAYPDYPTSQQQPYIESYNKLIHYFSTGDSFFKSELLASCLPFFDGVWVLVSIIHGRHGLEIRKKLKEELGIEILEKQSSLDRKSMTERLSLFISIAWVIDDWEHRFKDIFINSGVSKSTFVDHRPYLPFWLDSIVSSTLNKKEYIPSCQEYSSVKQYLEKINIIPTIVEISRLLGCSEKSAAKLRKKCT